MKYITGKEYSFRIFRRDIFLWVKVIQKRYVTFILISSIYTKANFRNIWQDIPQYIEGSFHAFDIGDCW